VCGNFVAYSYPYRADLYNSSKQTSTFSLVRLECVGNLWELCGNLWEVVGSCGKSWEVVGAPNCNCCDQELESNTDMSDNLDKYVHRVTVTSC
jgi:hypothetical protein